MEFVHLLWLGLLAGVVTTWIGLGGGIFMTLVLSVLFGPEVALATAAPALWVGNLHRVLLFRRHIARDALVSIGGAALVGAVVGGIVATALPARVLQGLVVAATGLALIPPPSNNSTFGRLWSAPLGALAGFVTATSGAGGVFLTPAVLARGVEGERFVATAALISVFMHTGRITAYAAGGWVTVDTLHTALILALCIMVGNFAGRWMRERTSKRVLAVALRGMMATLAVLAISTLA